MPFQGKALTGMFLKLLKRNIGEIFTPEIILILLENLVFLKSWYRLRVQEVEISNCFVLGTV